jgi:hypothetical protein
MKQEKKCTLKKKGIGDEAAALSVFTHIANICKHSFNKKKGEESKSAFHCRIIHKQEMKMQNKVLD